MKYLEYQNQEQEEVEKIKAKEANEAAKADAILNVEKVLLEIKTKLANKTKSLRHEKYTKDNFSAKKIYEISNEIDLLNRESEFYTKLKEELF